MTALTTRLKAALAAALKGFNEASELVTAVNLVANVTPGTASASKAVVLNSGSGVTGLGTVGVTTLSSTTANATTANLTNANIGRVQTTSTAVNAAGSAIGNATALSYGVNIVGAADNAKGVILPVAVTDGEVEVISIVNAKSLLVYPQVNSAIAGLAANAAFTIGPANTGGAANAQLNYAKFKATNTTQWYGHG